MTGLYFFALQWDLFSLFTTYLSTDNRGKIFGLVSGCPASGFWLSQAFQSATQDRNGLMNFPVCTTGGGGRSNLCCFREKGKSARKTGSSPGSCKQAQLSLVCTHRRWGKAAIGVQISLLTTFLDYSIFLPGYLYVTDILTNNYNVVRFTFKTLKVWVSQRAFHMSESFVFFMLCFLRNFKLLNSHL